MTVFPPRDGQYMPRDDPRSGRSEATRRVSNDIPPIHTVFIRNLTSQVTDEDLARVTKEYGEVSSIFSLAAQRGFAFVTFFDIRDAEKCVTGLEGRLVDGQTVHVAYAQSPSDNAKHDLLTCSTISAIANEGTQLTATEISAAFARYGDIKAIELGDRPNMFTVKYYDLRAAKQAVDDNGNVDINGEKIACVYNTKDDDDLKCIQLKEERREREKRERALERDSRRRDRRDTRYDYDYGYPGYPPPHMYGAPPYGYPPGQQYMPYPPYGQYGGYPSYPSGTAGYGTYTAQPQQQAYQGYPTQAQTQPPGQPAQTMQAVAPPPAPVSTAPTTQSDPKPNQDGNQKLLKIMFS